MSQTLVSLLVHIVFSTKERRPLIRPEVESELHRYMARTLKNLASPCVAVGGTANHVHPRSKNIALSYLMEELKKNSSKWIKTKGTSLRHFGWQDGYGAFSIGESQVEALKHYIARQKERHKKQTFEQEVVARYLGSTASRMSSAISGRNADATLSGSCWAGLRSRGLCPRLSYRSLRGSLRSGLAVL